MMNVPTMLTVARVVVVPFIAALFYVPKTVITTADAQAIATILFVAAAITDWLDGYLARKWNQQSDFGAFLDPVADKVCVATCVIVLVELGRLNPAIAIIIIGREIGISALREWMAKLGKSKVVDVAMAGKIKTAVQLIGIPFLLCDISLLGISSLAVGKCLMWVAAALTIWSMVVYFKAAFSGKQSVVLGAGQSA